MSQTNENAVVAALQAVLRDHGWLIASNPVRLRGMLSDVLGPRADELRSVVDAVVVSAEEGVASEIRDAGRPGLASISPGLIARLVDWGMTAERAAWVISAWSSQLPESTMAPATAAPSAPAAAMWPEPTSPEPTTLPRAELVPPLGATMLPPTPAMPADTAQSAPSRPAGTSRKSRKLVIAAAAAGSLVLAGTVGAIVLSNDEEPPKEATAEEERVDDTFLAATSTIVPTSIPPVGIGSRSTGLALVALSEPNEVEIADETMLPPEGGKLIAFELGDWSCDRPTCRPLLPSDVSVVVDGVPRDLPEEGPNDSRRYVMAIPSDAASVDLVLGSDGIDQSISLLTGEPAAGNISVLARDERSTSIDKTLNVTERVDIDIDYGDGIGRRSVSRQVTVSAAELKYFVGKRQTASSADRALMEVSLWYNYPQDDDPGNTVWYWRSDEVRLRDAAGTLYQPLRLPGTKGNPGAPWYSVSYYFDVPADITRADLVIGGRINLEASNGTPYVATTPLREVGIAFP